MRFRFCLKLWLSVALAAGAAVVPAGIVLAEEHQDVKTSVYLLNLGRLDTATGSYTVDFYLTFECDRPCDPDPSRFEFMNGRASATDKITDEPNLKIYRIQAALADNLNFRDYPFDSHRLRIALEDRDNDYDALRYVPGIDTSAVDQYVTVAGWQLTGFNARSVEHRYPTTGASFSRFEFAIGIARAPLASFFKVLLPGLFMLIVGLLGLLLAADKLVPRLTLMTSAIISSVLFHLNMTSSVPPLGYLTLADRFMVINYVALIVALGSSLLLLYHSDKKNQQATSLVYRTALMTVPAAWAISQGLNFGLGLMA